MKINKRYSKMVLALAAAGLATAAIAATLIQLDTPVVVSTTDPANNAYKAKMGWISYKSDPAVPQYDVKAQILVYADGAAGAQNIWIARSIDNGANWTQTPITNNGGTPLTIGASTFSITNNKPNIYVAPLGVLDAATHTKGANTLLTWTSSDCGGSAAQLINTNLNTGPQPYMCLWAARSLDGGVTWTTQRLTDGSIDPDEDVPAGFVKYTPSTTDPLGYTTAGGFAITYQADPTGLKQGDAEGPGDGASGSTVSPGTNIWYTFLTKANFELGTVFPAPVAVSNNTGTAVGDPGASRANLALSGSTAVLAYEETKSTGAKEIIYHSFPYNTPQTNSAGTSISDPASNARRVRFVLQGNEAIGDADADGDAADGDTAGVHSVIIWRDSASTLPDSPANIMMKRGIKNTTGPSGLTSTGFLATDLDATAVSLTGTSTTSNALAHRAVLRAEFAAVAYDYTADKAAADAYTATYNLFIKRSTDGGATWSAAKNMSNLTGVTTRVVEPRLVGTPGTIKLPDGTATADLSDVQNRNVFFVGWGTETNAAISLPLDIYLTRTTDQGVTYETVQTLAGGVTEQSEAQLRSPPDGKTLGALWMQRDAALNTTDVMYRNGTETTVPDPVVPPATTSSGGGGGCTAATGNAPFDPVLPMLAALGLIGLGARRLRR